MVKKKIDNRIRVMIENGVKLGHRTMFVIIGDKARDQVPILYDILIKSTVKARPTVLWCYKNKDEAISKYVMAQFFFNIHCSCLPYNVSVMVRSVPRKSLMVKWT